MTLLTEETLIRIIDEVYGRSALPSGWFKREAKRLPRPSRAHYFEDGEDKPICQAAQMTCTSRVKRIWTVAGARHKRCMHCMRLTGE